MAQQQQSREFEVSDLSSIPWLGKRKKKTIKYLTRFQVPREGLFDMVGQEPEDSRRCRKIFKTGRANDFQRISNQSRALLKGSEDVVRTSQTFLSSYTRYCLLGVRNLSECVNPQS